MARTSRAAQVAAAPPDDLDLNIRAFERHLLAEGKAEKTVRLYTQAARRLEEFLRQRGMREAVADIRREHAEEFFVALRAELSPATRNQFFRSLQAFWKYLIAEGEVTDSPLRSIDRPKIPDNPPPVVTPAQMRDLFRTCDGTTFANHRDTAILSLFYDTGIRRAEMAGLKLADIDQISRTIVTGKFSRQRIIRSSRETSRNIDRYLRRRAEHPDSDSPALWLGERGAMHISGIGQVVQRRAEQAGHPRISCHDFRHAAAHAMLSSAVAPSQGVPTARRALSPNRSWSPLSSPLPPSP